jgi:hypothetical protein
MTTFGISPPQVFSCCVSLDTSCSDATHVGTATVKLTCAGTVDHTEQSTMRGESTWAISLYDHTTWKTSPFNVSREISVSAPDSTSK